MEKQLKYVDEIFHFSGKWEMPSQCGLQIRKRDQGTLVILTELYEENPGSSVTAMIEELATAVVRKYSIDPLAATFILHNPQRSSKYEFFAETVYNAKMRWDGQRYLGVEWEKLEKLSQ